jgi:hypothetical protein
MARGSPFYSRTRTFQNDIYPPAVDADTANEWEGAHQTASQRIVAAEGELDLVPHSDDVDTIRVVTQSVYDQLAPADPRTLYFIRPG